MSSFDQETREKYGDPPSDDPVERAQHILRLYRGDMPRVFESTTLIDGTRHAYDNVSWTGMTWGDFQKLTFLAEQAQRSLEALTEIDALLTTLGAAERAPMEDGTTGRRMTPAERLKDLLTGRFQPRRDDAIARWLKRMRDKTESLPETTELYEHTKRVNRGAINGLLDRYRECAAYGLSLEPEDDEKGDP